MTVISYLVMSVFGLVIAQETLIIVTKLFQATFPLPIATFLSFRTTPLVVQQ